MVWLSIETWLITLLAITYLMSLVGVAYWGQKSNQRHLANKPWVYSLALGVSCTSWAFYGIIGNASTTGYWLSPIFIGTIASFIFAWPVMLKMLRVSKQQNITSLSDFIATRYDKAPTIAAVVATIAVIGTVPYISLQLRAISHSFDLVTGSYQSGVSTTFAVTIALILFSIFFGARNIAVNKQNQGLVIAIAFSSIIKLLAISIIGIYVTYVLFGGYGELLNQKNVLPIHTDTSSLKTLYSNFAFILLGAITIFVTPQLFHMIVIENNNEPQLKQARWQYPLYLVLINVFVLPIAIAGQLTFPGGGVSADTYILTLPLFHQEAWLSIIVFIGGLAAASSMVVIATIVLSTMVSTEIITPIIVRMEANKIRPKTQLASQLLTYRRFTIAIILLLAFIFDQLISQQNDLSSLGLLSFILLCQFAPAVIAALYWRKATSFSALSGLVAGTLAWAYTLLIPSLMPDSSLVTHGPLNISWLKPTALFALTEFDHYTHGTLISLLINSLVLILVSLYSRVSIGEKLQAERYIDRFKGNTNYQLTVEDLVNLLRRFIDQEAAGILQHKAQHLPANQQAPEELVTYTQNTLASVMGTASTKLVMNAAMSNHTDDSKLALEQVVHIVDEANQLFQFNRELLQAGFENIEQGISVVDADMKLVAWNKRYIELLNYPNSLIKVGMPIAELIEFNIQQGVIKASNPEQEIERRLTYMQSGNSHYYQRIMPNDMVLEIRGQAMPGGGFVSTFTDITKHIEAERALQKANENLEQKVQQRTVALSNAKAEAEEANRSKSRFLAAASHDLMQPFNALSLFTDMLKQQVTGSNAEELATQIQHSLSSVEDLLGDLVEISKLDSKGQQIEPEAFPLNQLLQPLAEEIKALADKSGIEFNYITTSVWVYTDKRLLRRIIQNFLSNAIYYSPMTHSNKARVILGVKHQQGKIKIEVWDNGPGIPEDKQKLIFKEFERLENNRDKPGLGLGLAISERIARLLNLPINMNSTINKGSMFSLTMPTIDAQRYTQTKEDEQSKVVQPLENMNILVIDNDALMLSALTRQVEAWGCNVTAVSGRQDWQSNQQQHIDFVIADYHLDDDDNGVDLVKDISSQLNKQLPCIVCSANPSEQLRQHCSDAGFSFMKKPVKGLALKRLIKQLT